MPTHTHTPVEPPRRIRRHEPSKNGLKRNEREEEKDRNGVQGNVPSDTGRKTHRDTHARQPQGRR